MPTRVNLSINDDLYNTLKNTADKKNISINSLIYEALEEKYSKHTSYDYTLALKQMIAEAKKMENEFTLADLQTFADVGDVIIEYKMKETPASVRARLGKMFNEAVRNGAVPGISRAVVEKNGVEELKFYCRAALYVNQLNKLKKRS
ncbi:hypothetical protein [Butyrivibrio sp. INlla16]|uniref:hypothetical protein n=1 Tax=Butyrivibrio sp. INlla16 TaxID=1520807 RepID=UPI0008901AA3|nr:hypothetical protein [Butyrivibrio sp. INlla16]SDB52318.1 hypothetical protein SAMN02910263_02650 [Butyrivibrio sp. INlla16]